MPSAIRAGSAPAGADTAIAGATCPDSDSIRPGGAAEMAGQRERLEAGKPDLGPGRDAQVNQALDRLAKPAAENSTLARHAGG